VKAAPDPLKKEVTAEAVKAAPDPLKKEVTAEAVKAAPDPLKDDVAAEAVQAVLTAKSSEHADITERLERLENRLPETASEALRSVLTAPRLTNWCGFVHVEVPGTGGDQRPVMAPGARGTVRVAFSQQDTGFGGERPIDIRNGEDAEEVTFRLIPTSDQVHFDADAVEIAVKTNGAAELPFTAPSDPGTHRLWVQVRQGGRTVQVVPAKIDVKKEACDGG